MKPGASLRLPIATLSAVQAISTLASKARFTCVNTGTMNPGYAGIMQYLKDRARIANVR